jgi:hypothetical protein
MLLILFIQALLLGWVGLRLGALVFLTWKERSHPARRQGIRVILYLVFLWILFLSLLLLGGLLQKQRARRAPGHAPTVMVVLELNAEPHLRL